MAEQRREMVKQILEEKKTEKPVQENPKLVKELEKKEIDDYEKHVDKDKSSLMQNKARSLDNQAGDSSRVGLTDTSEKGEADTRGSEQIKKDKKSAEPVIKGRMKEAVVNGKDLGISKKHAIAICNFIKGKDIDDAIFELEDVKEMKRAIPMRGEIPHRKGMMSGRYPVKSAEQFIRLLKSLRANAIYHELELEKFKIACMANTASRPQKRFGQSRFKRCHVQIKLIEKGK